MVLRVNFLGGGTSLEEMTYVPLQSTEIFFNQRGFGTQEELFHES
jgi:hypothetical protein